MALKMSRTTGLSIAIGISFSFFLVEIIVGLYTHSLALVADAFHYLNDLISFVVALVAVLISEKGTTNKDLSFGWQRAQLLGAFFNGVFLLAIGVSIFLQSIERFISLQRVENPMLMLIVGCVGFALNVVSAIFLHEHDHGPGEAPLEELGQAELQHESFTEVTEMVPLNRHREHRHKVAKSRSNHHHDLGMLSVMIHIAGDALNNVGVIIAATVIWQTHYAGRYYADPAVGMGIAVMILILAFPTVRKSGQILLQSPPIGVDVSDIKHDLEKIPGVLGVHELHVWRLNQQKALASVHITISDPSIDRFQEQAKTINECLHAYGVHSATIQPELAREVVLNDALDNNSLRQRNRSACQMNCGSSCEELTCCGQAQEA